MTMNKQMRKAAMRGLNQRERKELAGLLKLQEVLFGSGLKVAEEVAVEIISQEHFLGNYGWVGKFDPYRFKFNWLEDIGKGKKLSLNIMSKNNNFYFFDTRDRWGDTTDTVRAVYILPQGTELIQNGNEFLIKLENKQLFSIDSCYWLNYQDSMILKRAIAKGYKFYGVQQFFDDFFNC